MRVNSKETMSWDRSCWWVWSSRKMRRPTKGCFTNFCRILGHRLRQVRRWEMTCILTNRSVFLIVILNCWNRTLAFWLKSNKICLHIWPLDLKNRIMMWAWYLVYRTSERSLRRASFFQKMAIYSHQKSPKVRIAPEFTVWFIKQKIWSKHVLRPVTVETLS